MKILSKALTTVAGVAAVSAAMITDVQAIPAFARQTGMACVSCHAGNFPSLNAFGRAFLSSSYTMRGAAPLVEGEDLSIPADLKMSLVTKIRYELSDAVKGGRGEIQWPDEAGLLVGGRVGENIGGMAELDMLASGDTNNFANYKVAFNVTPNVNVVMYGTDGLGTGYGMELMNTGMKRSQRPIENRKGMSAFQRNLSGGSVGMGASEAEGIAVAYHDNDLLVSYSHWAPVKGNVNANIFGGLANNIRANYFMNVSGWDMGFGLSHMSGTVKVGATDDPLIDYEEFVAEAQGVDFQALGDLGTVPSEFYVSYAALPKSGSKSNVFNTTAKDATALGLLGKFYVYPRTSVYVAYGSTDDGTSATLNETTFGVQYMLAQNAKLELFNVNYSNDTGSDDYSMLMLFSGF